MNGLDCIIIIIIIIIGTDKFNISLLKKSAQECVENSLLSSFSHDPITFIA